MKLLAQAILLALAAGTVQAQEVEQHQPADPPADPAAIPAAHAPPRETRVFADSREYKSYGAAALEILGFQVVLNRIDHAFVTPDDYGVSIGSVRRNLRSSWVEDRDPFEINQMGHPYQGSVYFNIARSNGLTFWESMGYAFAGSAVWEIAGETTPPSRNDQITTSFGGSFLGEALYRMANLVLDRGDGTSPWREVGAGLVSPSLEYNRQKGSRRAASLWAGATPATFSRLQLGYSNPSSSNAGPSLATKRREVAADFALEYGLPGKEGYTYRKPFDYFLFRARVSNVNGLESLTSRGMLAGTTYGYGERMRGIAGIYGSYDYLSPQLFRIASTAVSLGSNAQVWLARELALQAHASAGVGYVSTGTIRASTGGQYHYGFAPQSMLGLRFIWDNRMSLDLSSSAFFDGKQHGLESGGKDRVLRGDASLSYRLSGPHALTLKYLTSRRGFSFPNVVARQQRYDSVGLYYSWQPARSMGAVNW
ncbi:DUF3943 domain-containing protein [Massilia aerilata]|uniref:DUF3943 domain-containing protein n=1 Tax=Massilia aerilata TaxID=453817 RepID=A0ABW0RX73_9BURK